MAKKVTVAATLDKEQTPRAGKTETAPASWSPAAFIEQVIQEAAPHYNEGNYGMKWQTAAPSSKSLAKLSAAEKLALFRETLRRIEVLQAEPRPTNDDIRSIESGSKQRLDMTSRFVLLKIQHELLKKPLALEADDLLCLFRELDNPHFNRYWHPLNGAVSALETACAIRNPVPELCEHAAHVAARLLELYGTKEERAIAAQITQLVDKSAPAASPNAAPANVPSTSAAEFSPQSSVTILQVLDRYLQQNSAQASELRNNLGDRTKLAAYDEALGLPPADQRELLLECCQRIQAIVTSLKAYEDDESIHVVPERSDAYVPAIALFTLIGGLLKQSIPLDEEDLIKLLQVTDQDDFTYTHVPICEILTAMERFAATNPLTPALRQGLVKLCDNLEVYVAYKLHRQQLARAAKLLQNAITMASTTTTAPTPPIDPQVASKARELLLQFAQQLWEKSEIRYDFWHRTLAGEPAGKEILALPPAEQAIVVAEALALARKYDALPKVPATDPEPDYFRKEVLGTSYAAWMVQTTITSILRRPIPLSEAGLIDLLRWAIESPNYAMNFLQTDKLHIALNHFVVEHGATPALRQAVQEFLRMFYSVWTSRDDRKTAQHLEALVMLLKGPNIQPGEAWSDAVLADLASMKEKLASAWNTLLLYCQEGGEKKFTAKFRKGAEPLLEAVGKTSFHEYISRWFPLVDKPRTQPLARRFEWEAVYDHLLLEQHIDLLRGLVWCCGFEEDADLARAVMRLALSAYRKIPGKGPRLVSLGNACVTALGMMPGKTPIGQLAVLKVKVKFGTAQKEIEKAFNAAAARENLPRDEVEELAVPTYGLTEIGCAVETLGEYTATLSIDGSDASLDWSKAGKPIKSVPAAVKSEHGEELKELQTALKDLRTMLPAQRERLDGLFLLQKSWPLNVWRERYLDHPLVGTLARRLIWTFITGGRTQAGAWHDDALRGVDGQPLALLDTTTVAIWHPIGHQIEEIVAWREWLETRRIVQPFKQAHREVYLLTDAERNTRTYSNRFAAHIIRQHQFNALALGRGWKNKLRLAVDDTYPPAMRALPLWNLRAEFWVEGIGDEYGVDTNEAGVYLRLATDQVRFYELEAQVAQAHASGGGYDLSRVSAEPVPLEQIPPLVLSEILRDVDLFVGVASVGNDPSWNDGGPAGRHVDYWHRFSFGELSQTANTRKTILEKLLPRLKIAAQCRLEDRFLRVQGTKRNYRIHLGSGNILMEPNDQYLCIVPKQSGDPRETIFLPFEGDNVLSIILSKAMLLAADDKIKDSTILSQIER